MIRPRLPPERLYKAVLVNMNSWLVDLDAIIEEAHTGAKVKALTLKRNILQAKLSLSRLAGDTTNDEESDN